MKSNELTKIIVLCLPMAFTLISMFFMVLSFSLPIYEYGYVKFVSETMNSLINKNFSLLLFYGIDLLCELLALEFQYNIYSEYKDSLTEKYLKRINERWKPFKCLIASIISKIFTFIYIWDFFMDQKALISSSDPFGAMISFRPGFGLFLMIISTIVISVVLLIHLFTDWIQKQILLHIDGEFQIKF